jgi:glycosyltransferase involved in cell wall biosynthesis
MQGKSILILGFFFKTKDQKTGIRTAEDRVAEMFVKDNIRTITSSTSYGKFSRLFDTVNTIISKRKTYNVAIVPLFGTLPSFIWQEIATRLLKLLRKKIIMGVHGGSIPERIEKGENKFIKAMERADVLVAPSRYFSEYLHTKGFKVHIIENPVDLSEYAFHPKETLRPRILWMRAFTDIYNPAMAVKVAKRLAEKYENFQMIMAGKDGPLTSFTKKIAEENGLSNQIIFPGYINMRDKLLLANDYDIYINTNKIDNAPVSLIEFMHLGLPVISVNVGGIPYLIKNEQNGLLVNDDDDEAMFNQITRLIENSALAKNIIMNAYEYAQQYDEKKVIEKWKALLCEVEDK